MTRTSLNRCRLALLLALLAPAPLAAQERACVADAIIDVPDPFGLRFDARRILELTGATEPRSMLLRRISAESGARVCAAAARPLAWAIDRADADTLGNFDWSLVPPSVQLGYNSDAPRDRNNGAVWGGVGTTTAATLGVRARWRWFDFQLAPRVHRAANADFATAPVVTAGYSPWTSRWHTGLIDWYQRPGDEPLGSIEPGQSFVRATLGPASIGFATENVWIGPMRIYPILMSSTAAGFPHVFAETSTPVGTPIGGIEARALWGKLSESEWFDAKPANDDRMIAALLLAWSPRWIPGLSVGAARVYEEVLLPGETDLAHWFGTVIDPSFLGSQGGNRGEGNGIAALYGRWAFPRVGFEVFGEWTREDTPWNMKDVLSEPDWTQAYAIGFQQFIGDPAATRGFRWYGELVHLGESAPLRAGRGLFSYYTHNTAVQGHTERGQLLGAWTGPGSDAQVLGVDMLYQRGLSGLWVERNRYDDDTYYRRFADRWAETRHDVELVIGLRQLYSIAGLELEGSVTRGLRYNRYFLGLENEEPEARRENNWGLDLRAQWRPQLVRR